MIHSVYFDILKRVDVAHESDIQTDGQTDELTDRQPLAIARSNSV